MKAELLAPVGNMESLRAALACGADAVYIGLGEHSARADAGFSREMFYAAVTQAHAAGVRVYLALNILFTDRELSRALADAASAAACKADAVIVQDLGLLSLLREQLPDLPLHASTQMSVQTAAGLALLQRLGVRRAVLPRELTRRELAALLRASPIECEVFVHGAHCMSVSGQCRLSAALGGRSGNRGNCAQPCRLPWRISGQAGNRFALSLKDRCCLDEVTAQPLSEAASLKIEGRRKRPEYVAAAVTAYRAALDGKPSAVTKQMLREVFSRQGFTNGYTEGSFQKGDASMFGTRAAEDKASPEVLGFLRGLYKREPIPTPALSAPLPETPNTALPPLPPPAGPGIKPQLWLQTLQPEALPRDISGITRLFLPWNTPADTLCCHAKDREVGITLPGGIFGNYDRVLSVARTAKAAGAAYALCDTLDGVALAREAGLLALGGQGLNLHNSYAFQTAYALGVQAAVCSPELNAAQIRDLKPAIPAVLVAYGRLPLMLLRACPIRAQMGCKACRNSQSLTDRKGIAFPVRCDGLCAVLYNSRPHYLADKVKLCARSVSALLISLTAESQRESERVLERIRSGNTPEGSFTRGSF
ncbi:MAG: U32 family peptidase [Oscillospiraceae bacterium]|jgi:collagenase-like PrtC family protease|nr:U32 family peptidase [Oscillospiraceae bacterium]